MRNILLYLSAFIPMYLLVIIKQCIEIIIGNIKPNFFNFLVVGILVLVIVLGLLGLKMEIFDQKETPATIILVDKTNTTDEHFLGYFSLFVLFAISFDLSKISMLVVFVLIVSMIGVVYVKNKLFYINPFLNILGYNFYDITYKEGKLEKPKSTKIFFKGDLLLQKEYSLIVNDENFSFLTQKNVDTGSPQCSKNQ